MAWSAAPVTGHRTRYEAQHPLRGMTPDQKGCTAYGSGAAHPVTRTNAEAARRRPDCGARERRQGLVQSNFACNSPTTQIDARPKTAEYQRL